MVAREILGPDLLEALVAVRRHEVVVAAEAAIGELVERFRFAWSV
jgi:glutamine synthetase